MNLWLPVAILCIVIGTIYLGAVKLMNRALNDLGQVQGLMTKEFMACKCQETKTPTEETPCTENELSFKQAYFNLNKQYVQVCAQRQELIQRLEAFQIGAKNIVKSLDDEKQSVQTYASRALEFMDDQKRKQFLETYGHIPGGVVL